MLCIALSPINRPPALHISIIHPRTLPRVSVRSGNGKPKGEHSQHRYVVFRKRGGVGDAAAAAASAGHKVLSREAARLSGWWSACAGWRGLVEADCGGISPSFQIGSTRSHARSASRSSSSRRRRREGGSRPPPSHTESGLWNGGENVTISLNSCVCVCARQDQEGRSNLPLHGGSTYSTVCDSNNFASITCQTSPRRIHLEAPYYWSNGL